MMIPWFEPSFGPEEPLRVAEVLHSGYINDGEVTREFERAVARFVGRKHAVAVTSGTAAIALSLMAMGVRRGNDVIVPDFTFIATANAVCLAGANVILCDVERDTMCLSVKTIEPVISNWTTAIVAVEINGRSPGYEELTAFCEDRGLVLITDSCESLGSIGLARAGLASCLSFSPAKIITTGQGGMVLTDDDSLHEKLRILKDQGRRKPGTGGGDDKHESLGFNFKFTDLQAAVGLAQLEKIDERIAAVRKRNKIYRRLLGSDEIGFRLWFDIIVNGVNRFHLIHILHENGFDTRPFWRPLHTQAPYLEDSERFPNATYLADHGLWLPSSFDLTRDQIKAICSCMEPVDA